MAQVHLMFYICLLLWGYCSQNPVQRSINKNRDSLYTEQYIASISILLLLLLWRIWKYNRTIKYKNATLLQYINEGLSNQNKLQETYKSLHLPNEKEKTIYPQNDSNTHNEEQEQIENKVIFEKLNFTIAIPISRLIKRRISKKSSLE